MYSFYNNQYVVNSSTPSVRFCLFICRRSAGMSLCVRVCVYCVQVPPSHLPYVTLISMLYVLYYVCLFRITVSIRRSVPPNVLCCIYTITLFRYITMAFPLGKVAALRTFRVLRALKTVAVVPGKHSIDEHEKSPLAYIFTYTSNLVT